MIFIGALPESPRWYCFHDKTEQATESLKEFMNEDEAKQKCDDLVEAHKQESESKVGYKDMFTPGHGQFHPTMLTIMGQVNQALTGYGGMLHYTCVVPRSSADMPPAVSVYGPQIFELLGYGVRLAEYLTMANYISYLILMTFAWLLIDALGRRTLLLNGSGTLTLCFSLLALFGGLSYHASELHIHNNAVAIPGIVVLFIATGAFGIGWLVPPWLIPTEIYPTTCRAQGTAVSVIIWGLANFTVTLITPLMFNNLKFYLFLVFAGTNLFAGVWTYFYCPETGGRTFEDNQEFFRDAKKEGTWQVQKVKEGEFRWLPYPKPENPDDESQPLLRRIRDQVHN